MKELMDKIRQTIYGVIYATAIIDAIIRGAIMSMPIRVFTYCFHIS